MSVIVRGTGGAAAVQNMLLVKGAAECVVERCSHMMLAGGAVKPLSESLRKQLLASVDSMAEGALRCLALAQKVSTSLSHIAVLVCSACRLSVLASQAVYVDCPVHPAGPTCLML